MSKVGKLTLTARANARDSEILRYKLNPKTANNDWDDLIAHLTCLYDFVGWEHCPNPSRFTTAEDLEKLWGSIKMEGKQTQLASACAMTMMTAEAAGIPVNFESTDAKGQTHQNIAGMLTIFADVRALTCPLFLLPVCSTLFRCEPSLLCVLDENLGESVRAAAISNPHIATAGALSWLCVCGVADARPFSKFFSRFAPVT